MKEIGSLQVVWWIVYSQRMTRIFGDTLIFGVSRRDASSGKIYQAPLVAPLSLFLLPFRGCVYETADHSLVLVSLHGRNLFRTNYRHQRIRASRKSLTYSPSFSVPTYNPQSLPHINKYLIIRNKYSLYKLFPTIDRWHSDPFSVTFLSLPRIISSKR